MATSVWPETALISTIQVLCPEVAESVAQLMIMILAMVLAHQQVPLSEQQVLPTLIPLQEHIRLLKPLPMRLDAPSRLPKP